MGAAIASLVSMVLNVVLAYGMLNSTIHVRVDTKSVINLVVSALIMSGSLLVYLYVLPVRDFVSLGLVLAFGAIIYFSAVLAIDRTIRNDLKDLLVTMRLPIIP
jgi:O-antigen/teichoic acid export membrane protein